MGWGAGRARAIGVGLYKLGFVAAFISPMMPPSMVMAQKIGCASLKTVALLC